MGIRGRLQPGSIIYLLVNALIFVIGLLVLNIDEIKENVLREGIGISLVSTGIAGAILYLHVRSESTLKNRLDSIYKSRILKIFPARAANIRDEYTERLENSSEIDVLGLGLSAFREDFRGKLIEWARAGRDIRILVLDPDFPSSENSLARIRDLEEGNDIGRIGRESERFIDDFAETARDWPNFRVRYYQAIPSLNMLRAGNEMFWGPYIVGTQSRNMPTLLVEQGGFLFENLKGHFEKLWTDQNFSRDPYEIDEKT